MGKILFKSFSVRTTFLPFVKPHLCAQRWGLTNGKNVVRTEKDLKRIFPKKMWSKLHLQIIFYGREYSEARSCFGIECKICKTCYPTRKKPIKTKKA